MLHVRRLQVMESMIAEDDFTDMGTDAGMRDRDGMNDNTGHGPIKFGGLAPLNMETELMTAAGNLSSEEPILL